MIWKWAYEAGREELHVQAYSAEDDDKRVSKVEDVRYAESETQDHANDARPVCEAC
jgi:hypothetical protein